MKIAIIPLLAVLGLSACATTRMSDTDRLALYQAHAGAPVDKIRNLDAIGWDEIDDEHVVLTMRPNESWLMKLSGPCLDWSGGASALRISSTGAYITAKFDRILTEGAPAGCRIEEIRPVDVKAVRAAQAAMQAQAPSGM